jgi:putative drug exporter of the RND superfamily
MAEARAARDQRPGLVVRLSGWVRTHRKLVLIGWVAVLIASMGTANAAKNHFVNNLSLSGTDSQRATDLLGRDFPAQAGDIDQIVLHTRGGRLTDRALRTQIGGVLASVAHLPHVTGVVSPFSPSGAHAISADGRTGFATIAFDERADLLPKDAVKKVIGVARERQTTALQVELGGRAIEQATPPSLGAATAIGLVAAIFVLLLTFGSALAAGLPIITALLGLGTGLGLIGLASHVLDTPDFSTQLAALLGLGVGIDYALFVVTRFRESYAQTHDVERSITVAMDTAGRAVLFAGITVIIALLGLLTIGITLLDAAALAVAATVALVLTAALTVMPALLSRFGERIGQHTTRRRSVRRGVPFWPRWAALVARHPWQSLAAGLAIMLVLCAPAATLRLGQSDAGNDPATHTSRRAYDLLAGGFGKGFNGPLQVVAQLPRAGDAAGSSAIAGALRSTSGVAAVSAPVLSPTGTTVVYQAFPTTSPESQATTDLVNRLRDHRLPPVARATRARIFVGGSTAVGIDFAHVLASKLALFIAAVIVLAGLLLVAVFRSLVIPVQAAVMNLLSVGASLGVTVAVFQKGWLGDLFGVTPGPIESFIPVILFAIVFGLSMDYEVFLVSRIHEAWTRRQDSTAALIDGVGSTGRVVTAAATIMVGVFISFVLGDDRIVKMFGLGLASAVFLDAFVVRSLLLPAVLTLSGERTWKLPHALERRLPRIALEAPSQERARHDRGSHVGGLAEEPA